VSILDPPGSYNEALLRTISIEEVCQAIKEIPAGKSPGPDGFTTVFFHLYSPMVREEVWQLVEDVCLS
jgi:hypothetical protein